MMLGDYDAKIRNCAIHGGWNVEDSEGESFRYSPMKRVEQRWMVCILSFAKLAVIPVFAFNLFEIGFGERVCLSDQGARNLKTARESRSNLFFGRLFFQNPNSKAKFSLFRMSPSESLRPLRHICIFRVPLFAVAGSSAWSLSRDRNGKTDGVRNWEARRLLNFTAPGIPLGGKKQPGIYFSWPVF